VNDLRYQCCINKDVKYGPDYSRGITNHGPVDNSYDHSRHITHFERFDNRSQYIGTNNASINFGLSPPDDGNYFYQDPRRHRPNPNAQTRRYPGDPHIGFDRGSADNSRASSVRGEGPPSRSDTQRPSLKNRFLMTSPEMQEYVRQLQKQAKSRGSTSQPDDEDVDMDWGSDESDSDREKGSSRMDEHDDDHRGAFRWEEPSMSFPAGHQRSALSPPYNGSFQNDSLFHDNRTYTMNINSHNVNQTTIQDSYNDNSTSTVIREKKAAKRPREEPDN